MIGLFQGKSMATSSQQGMCGCETSSQLTRLRTGVLPYTQAVNSCALLNFRLAEVNNNLFNSIVIKQNYFMISLCQISFKCLQPDNDLISTSIWVIITTDRWTDRYAIAFSLIVSPTLHFWEKGTDKIRKKKDTKGQTPHREWSINKKEYLWYDCIVLYLSNCSSCTGTFWIECFSPEEQIETHRQIVWYCMLKLTDFQQISLKGRV